MPDAAHSPEWLRYFIKRPLQAVLVVTATVLFFVALKMFLNDVGQIEKSHISIEDGQAVIQYVTDSLLVIIPTAIIFFFVGVLYTVEHGVFGTYMAWVVIAVGLILLMVAAVENDVGVKLIFSNAGWVAFSAGFGFFAGVHIEKLRRSPPESDSGMPGDAGASTKSSVPVRTNGKKAVKAGKN